MRAHRAGRQKESAGTPGLPPSPTTRSFPAHMSLTPLTAEQLDAARTWLAALDFRTRQRGEELVRDGAVFQLESYKRGVGLRGMVFGTYRYAIRLRYEDPGWTGSCSCPVSINCKHCCATMLAALAHPGEPAPEPGPEYSDETAASFAIQLGERLGRKLTSAELQSAREVDRLFREHRSGKLVPKSSLDVIVRGDRRGVWTWESVPIWSVSPRTPWETWLYVAAYLRREKLSCPNGLLDATDWADVDALVADWERHERVAQWRDWLAKHAQTSASATPERRELRVRLTPEGAQLEWRKDATADFKPMAPTLFQQLVGESLAGRIPFEDTSRPVWQAFHTGYGSLPFRRYDEPDCARILNTLVRREETLGHIVGPQAQPLIFNREPLAWRVGTDEAARRVDYWLALMLPDGSTPPPPLVVLDGTPTLHLTRDTIYPGPPLSGLNPSEPQVVPAEALETAEGLALLDRLGVEPPAHLALRVRTVKLRPVFRCELVKNELDAGEHLVVQVFGEAAPGQRDEAYHREGWQTNGPAESAPASDEILRCDRSALAPVPGLIEALRLQWWPHENHWHKAVSKKFADQFVAWLTALPADLTLELDPLLASFRDTPVRATVKLEVEESSIDWFDLRIALDVADTSLTREEIKLLLDARGGFVRLGTKGWRRLAFELSENDEAQLAELGLSARDFSSAPQRLHALQLAGQGATHRLLDERHAAMIERRATEIQTRVSPPVPAALRAELRPYQLAGFHFLAYLTVNRFGGILADDMGLGKTVQTLAWLLWLQESPVPAPSLVVCPKSVTDNWSTESARFAPSLRVRVLERGASDAAALKAARAEADLIVLNYTQLRLLEKPLCAAPWHAVILDEAQAIKNPESQTARAAWALKCTHRLALSGTPIENRLLDLWSIMAFAMPGILGHRAAFARTYDQRSDPFSRRRLAARVRPFVLRRTKGEVAKDLPERVEEDLHCELDGVQATLYRAELKRARAALLKITTTRQLDQARFNILTSLLRLRQICCHPALVSTKAAEAESAKLTALFDLLEPLVEEGHKVLVFSQFVGMLNLIRAEIVRRDWPHFLLTGDTEDRGALVANFQGSDGAAVFLISLRAGGFGLNLTAASYVVLYDPWWNPAVENQAIDRTHRIGQTSKVIAYRLLVKNSIEEKIRHLQKQKSALVSDILGEESFTRSLTLSDFQFLLAE
jgi:SNF2-related domain/Helicase conserved C-terminal domain